MAHNQALAKWAEAIRHERFEAANRLRWSTVAPTGGESTTDATAGAATDRVPADPAEPPPDEEARPPAPGEG
jgi:hypothetical protein